jgi:hypothetical protein
MTAANELLNLWEAGAHAMPAGRDEALLSLFGEAPPVTLSGRNAALFRLRSQLFGSAQQLRCNCAGCGGVAEFVVDCDALSQSVLQARSAQRAGQLNCEGYLIHFRLPETTDVRAAAGLVDAAFEDALLTCCVTQLERADQTACAIRDLPEGVIEQLSARMEELEPGASISFEVTCPECGITWSAPMNVGDVIWTELQARAERLILDVDLLARTYGWTEASILAMSPARRAAYLQLAGSVS